LAGPDIVQDDTSGATARSDDHGTDTAAEDGAPPALAHSPWGSPLDPADSSPPELGSGSLEGASKLGFASLLDGPSPVGPALIWTAASDPGSGFVAASFSPGDSFGGSPAPGGFDGAPAIAGGPQLVGDDSHSSGSSSQGGSSGTGGGSASVTGSATGGLNIVVDWDASTSNAPAAFATVINQVVQFYETHFSDPVTITIDVGFGEVAGSSLAGNALGESETYLDPVSYATMIAALKGDAKDATDQSVVASLPATNPNGGNYWIATAEEKALGLTPSVTPVDGYVGFSGQSGIFDYNNSDGVSAGQYDFYGVVAHEFSEVMGRMLLVGGSIGSTHNSYDPLDLLHYSAPGVHDFSGSTAGYFSVDGGQTNLDNFNTVAGGDAGDWAASAAPDSFLAFDNPGVVAPVTSTDLTVLDAIGWDAASATPPPPAPDLTVSNLALSFATGGAASLSFHINNIGTAEADNFSNSVALYSDSALTHQVGLQLASVTVSALAAGASVTEPLTLSLTAPGLAGTYYIGVVADSGKTVTESNESNNTAALPVILGTSNASTLNGTTGNDTIIGFSGHDTFYGGKGNDTLVVDGSTHANQFVFKATTDGLDTIVNFASGDVLDFSASVFGRHMAVGGGNTGTLDPSHFVSNGTETPSARTPEFWYDNIHNTLYYDSDGTGPAAPVAMAVLGAGTNLQSSDIHLI
jgi:hypothetical protein